MIIQRNKKDGVNTFNKKWKEFEEGFGDFNGDKLWYGLKAGQGWWHNNCYHIAPNRQPSEVEFNSKWYNLLSVEMKMRQHDCISQ